ncbi:MAG: dihydrolipoyl dehydrogenase [Acidobacteriota bacterium]
MSSMIEVRVPDMGDIDEVDVVEILVAPGDRVDEEQGLVSLESDKASMEVPAPAAGVVAKVEVAAGDQVSAGTLVAVLEAAGASDAPTAAEPAAAPAETAAEQPSAVDAKSESPPAPIPGAAEVDLGDTSDADLVCEVVVLGSGPGGYTAAFRAADLGRDVVLVERYDSLGGVCLNVGCIPSKALLHMARVVDEAAAMAEHGVTFGEPTIDLDALRRWKDGVVSRLTGGLATMAKQRKVATVTGTGRFTGPHRMRVETAEGPKVVAFEQAIIAAGSRSVRLPGFPYDDDRLLDSTSALELRDVPGRLLVIGGGIIGLEMATVYHALGTKVTVVELMDGLMPGADRDMVRPFQKHVASRYEKIFLFTKVSRLEAEEGGLRAHFEGPEGGDAPESALFDRVLLSVGRTPNGKEIGAEAAGVPVDDRGFLTVDKQMRTAVPHIFAIGDIVGQPMLAHKAVHEGKVAAEAASGHRSFFDARGIPSVAYTDPEVAWVGLTETQAKAEGVRYGKGIFPWSASGRALGMARPEGKTKLLFEEDTKRLIGAAVVGPHAGDLIAELALALEMGCDAEDIGLTIHPHPTLSETVGLSAEAFEGTITDLYLPKRSR